MVISLTMVGAAHGAAPLRPDLESLERATPALVERMRVDPYDCFRFVNRSWIARICDDFSRDLEGLPVIRLHGDDTRDVDADWAVCGCAIVTKLK